MQKAMIIISAAAAILLAGATAQAETWRGASGVGAAVPNYTPIRPAACQGWGPFCPPGYVRACGRWRCWCRPCY